MDKLKGILKSAPWLMHLAALLYNIVHHNNAWRFKRKNSIKYDGAFLKNTRFRIYGKGNRIEIGPKARLNGCTITIYGNDSLVKIGGGHTIVSGTDFWLEDGSCIVIGNDFMAGKGSHIAACEGADITIGDDCMLSEDIEIRSSDSHSIFSTETKQRINKAKPIVIGSHVWITAHVRILKGSTIANNSVIGNSCVVSTALSTANGLYVGNPCRLVKNNIDWNKYRFDVMP